MDEILNIELTGIQQEMSLDILLNESNRLNNTIKSIDESTIQEGIGDVLKSLKDKVVEFIGWLWRKIRDFFGKIINAIKSYFSLDHESTIWGQIQQYDDSDYFDDDDLFEDFAYDDEDFEDDDVEESSFENIRNNNSIILNEEFKGNIIFDKAVNFFNKYYKGKEIEFGNFSFDNVIHQYYKGTDNFFKAAVQEAVVPKQASRAKIIKDNVEDLKNYVDQINKDKENLKYNVLDYMTSSKEETSESTFSEDVLKFYTQDAFSNRRFSVVKVTSKNLNNYSKKLIDCITSGSFWINEIKKLYNSFSKDMNAIKKNCIDITESENSQLVNAFISYNSVATEMGLKLVSIGNKVASFWTKEANKIVKNIVRNYSKFRKRAIQIKKSKNK